MRILLLVLSLLLHGCATQIPLAKELENTLQLVRERQEVLKRLEADIQGPLRTIDCWYDSRRNRKYCVIRQHNPYGVLVVSETGKMSGERSLYNGGEKRYAKTWFEDPKIDTHKYRR